MRVLVAIVMFVAALAPLESMADTAHKTKRTTKPPQHKADVTTCEERARHEDPTGDFTGFPCWAREALARGRNNDNN